MLVTDLERLKKLKLTAVEAARYSLAVVLNARVAQWIERLPPEQEVAGSTPAASTKYLQGDNENGARREKRRAPLFAPKEAIF